MTRPRGRRAVLSTLVLITASLVGCRSSERVFVCPVGEAGWDEWRMMVTVLEVADDPDGLRIVGRVTDAETDDLLIGTSVAILGTSRGSVVQTDGQFVLDRLEIEQFVRFSFAGYAPFEVSVRELAGLEDD